MKRFVWTMSLALCAATAMFGCDVIMDGNGNGNANENMNDNMNDNDGGDEAARMFSAPLSGDQEVPPVTTDATGMSSYTISEDDTSIEFDISAEGLSGPATAMHLHMAAAGENGDVVVDVSGSITNGDDGSMTAMGTADLGDGIADAIRAGDIYLNIHTEENPGGEIRGQLAETATE